MEQMLGSMIGGSIFFAIFFVTMIVNNKIQDRRNAYGRSNS